ncbi:MAG: hydrogenase maturation protease [Hyphomicrobiaceae bacterium]|nr:hydrogenase maturation protease [Hyphomicrobiaceae bacterium]
MTDDRPLIVGIGNPFRSDDGAGPYVATKLGGLGFLSVTHEGDGTGLMDLFERHRSLVLVDATLSGRVAGTVTSFDAIGEKLPAELFHYSTHRFGLAEAVETARALGSLPERLLVFGIEGADFSAGTALSPAVQGAADVLVLQLSRELADGRNG